MGKRVNDDHFRNLQMTTVTARIICLEDTSLFLHHWDEGELSAWRDKYNRV